MTVRSRIIRTKKKKRRPFVTVHMRLRQQENLFRKFLVFINGGTLVRATGSSDK
jgi:hypothetical protein